MSTRQTVPAVVYPSATGSGFGVISSLAAGGVRVTGLNPRKGFTRFSRLFKNEICPQPEKSPEGFIQHLVSMGQKNPKSALFIVDDMAVFLVSKNKELLEPYYYYPFLEDKALMGGLDKWTMVQVTLANDIPTPFTRIVTHENDVDRVAAELKYPAILKPVVSRFVMSGEDAVLPYAFREVTGYARAVGVSGPEAFKDICRKALLKGLRILAQEEIPGPQSHLYTVNVYINQKGEVLEPLTQRKIRQMPADFGIMSSGECVEGPEVELYTKKYVEAIGFRGLASVEFKLDPRDGLYKFIELNPRAPHGISLSTRNGYNYSMMQYCDLTAGKALPSRPPKKTKKWFHLEGELNYVARYRWDKKSPYYLGFWSWVLFLARDPFAEPFLSWRDPLMSSLYLYRSFSKAGRIWAQHAVLKWAGVKITRKGISKKGKSA